MKKIARLAKLLKCGICGNWFSPRAHSLHCDICGAYPLNNRHYAFDEMRGRFVEMVSGLKRPTINDARLREMARILAE